MNMIIAHNHQNTNLLSDVVLYHARHNFLKTLFIHCISIQDLTPTQIQEVQEVIWILKVFETYQVK